MHYEHFRNPKMSWTCSVGGYKEAVKPASTRTDYIDTQSNSITKYVIAKTQFDLANNSFSRKRFSI